MNSHHGTGHKLWLHILNHATAIGHFVSDEEFLILPNVHASVTEKNIGHQESAVCLQNGICQHNRQAVKAVLIGFVFFFFNSFMV